jgi:phenylacetic acid degradation operon negative regulatory protein
MILGEYVAPSGGSAFTEVLVEALDLLGVREKAARQAIARLGAEGMIEPHREGRRVRWELTDRGIRWLAEGRARSMRFHEPADAFIGRWLLLVVNLSDEQRDLRYHVNRRLVSFGWGSIGNSMWLNSGAVPEDAVVSTLRRLGLEDSATMLRAEFRPPTRLEALIERAWDLPNMAARHREFLAEHGGPPPTSDAEAFARRSQVVSGFTHWFWTDPRLPPEFLPPDWKGDEVIELVRRGYLDWRAPAMEWWVSRRGASAPRRPAP